MNIKERIKEVIEDKDLKIKLLKEFEGMISNKYIKKEEINEKSKIDKNENIKNNIMDKVKKIINEKLIIIKDDEIKFKEKIKKLEKELCIKYEEINKIKLNI